MTKAHRAVDAAITIRSSVISLLSRLKKKFTLVLLTDFPGLWGREIMKNRGLSKIFALMVFGNESPFTKPDPRLLGYVLSRFSEINPENVTIVDDTPAALVSGRDLLMQTILVENERSTHTVLVPDSVVKNVLEIEKILEKSEKLNE